MTASGKCRLCDNIGELQESHVIPRFVFEHQKKTSATGFLRGGEAINRRLQDGDKYYWFCRGCEELLNSYETPFATHIYHAWDKHWNSKQQFEYGPWLMPLACSISWRTLTWYIDQCSRKSVPLSPTAQSTAQHALDAWRNVVRGHHEHPAEFQQHMFLFDSMESYTGKNDFPPNMNRFLTRGVHINLAHSGGIPLFIFTKMGRITLLGFIGIKYPRQWVGSQIHVKGGLIGGNITAPVQFLDYLKSRARVANEQYALLSEKQKQVISQSIGKNQDRAAESDTFDMIARDIDMFGSDAVYGEKKDV